MAEYYIHPTAIVDEGAELGAGTKVWHFCHIMPKAKIGERCVLGQNVMVARGVHIGHGCKIQNNVSIYEGVTLADEVFCGPSLVFTNVRHPRAFVSRRDEFAQTLVGRGATLGANATILCGINVGEYTMLAAGAFLNSDTKAYALMAGSPAVQIGWVCYCGETLTVFPKTEQGSRQASSTAGNNFQCRRCNSRYQQSDGNEPSLAPV